MAPSQQDNEQPQPQLLPVPNPMPSYWLQTPHRYANLRSTPDVPHEVDIAIIGAGMAGVLTLYHILQQTRHHSSPPNVLLLDARALCSGATARNGGHTKVKTATLAGLSSAAERNAFQRYVHNSISALKDVIEDEDLVAECEFELRRSFDVFLDADELDAVKSVYDADRRGKEAWTRDVSFVGEEVVRQVTSVQGAKGAFCVRAASFWPYRFVTRVLEILVEREGERVNVQMHTPVTSIALEQSEGGSADVNLITTSRGVVRAGKLVLATNAYTAGLLDMYKDTIVPYKGMASHHTPTARSTSTSSSFLPSFLSSAPKNEDSAIHPHLTNTYNIHFAPSHGISTGVDYMNPRPDGGIVVGGGNWMYSDDKQAWLGNFDDSEATGRFGKDVEGYWGNYMSRNFLGWEGRGKNDMVWMGIMGRTGDGMVHVGRVPGAKGTEENKKKDKRWVLAGFNGGGMALIPITAKAVARMVVNDVDFEDVCGEFGIPEGFRTSRERLKEGV